MTFSYWLDMLQVMKKKFILAFLIVSIIALILPANIWAAKKRPPRGSGKGTTVKRTYTRGARVSVKFRPDRRGLLINFSSFGNAVSVTYTLTYNSNGIPQGAGGTATPETAGEQREVLFGTCSAGVCRFHTNITNARLTIDSKLNSGLIIRKPYRIKI